MGQAHTSLACLRDLCWLDEVRHDWVTPLIEYDDVGHLLATKTPGPCAAATLRYATPSDGWPVDVGGGGSDDLDVRFESGDRDTRVRVECIEGVPRFEVDLD